MDLRPFTWHDESAIHECVSVRNAVAPPTPRGSTRRPRPHLAGHFRYGWDLEPPTPFLAVVDREVVGFASLSTSERDNLHLAWLNVEIHPDHRRQGHGSAAVEGLIARARELGRTSVGIAGWDGDVTRAFAERHGFELGSVSVNRRQTAGRDRLGRRRAPAGGGSSARGGLRAGPPDRGDAGRRARRAGRDDRRPSTTRPPTTWTSRTRSSRRTASAPTRPRSSPRPRTAGSTGSTPATAAPASSPARPW